MPKAQFNRGFPAKEFARSKWCPACRASRHRDCAHHQNDHVAEPQEDVVIDVQCECPCDGEIRGDALLIDLIAELRTRIAELQGSLVKDALEPQGADVEDWGEDFARLVGVDLYEALYDDEEKLNVDATKVGEIQDQIFDMINSSPIKSMATFFPENPPAEQPG